MTRRAAAVAVLAIVAFTLAAWPASAALREVAVGNFYFNDATPGDGVVEATQGDQLRFTVYDGGPGTPHTVDVDALGIHSGSLASGETFTTPPLDKPGTYTLYCKPHVNRGHTATLIVRASATATTKPATTVPPITNAPATVPPVGRATTTAPVTTAPLGSAGRAATTTTPTGGGPGTTTAGGGSQGTTAAGGGSQGTTTDGGGQGTATTALAPVGRGEADSKALADRPVDPDSLQAALGRPAASKGSWTRSVRLALVALVAMLGAVAIAARRSRRLD